MIEIIHLPLPVFHGIGLVLIALLIYTWARHSLKHWFVRVSFWVLSLLGVYMPLMAVFVWSELYFTFLLLLLLLVYQLRRQLPWADILLVVVAFALCLQRSAGFFCIGRLGIGLGDGKSLFYYALATHRLGYSIGE